jgi:putative membrane protein insertion efficiency factor
MRRDGTELALRVDPGSAADATDVDVCPRGDSRDAASQKPVARPGVVRRLLVGIITAYQRLISPYLGPRCRFTPSCSEYAREAILVRGPLFGIALAVFRLLRCQPFCAGGYDPVPLPRADRAAAARSVSDSLHDSDPTDAPQASAEGAPAC